MSRRAAFISIFLFVAACGKSPAGKGGAAVPELKLDTLLQAPMQSLAGLPDLKGKVVVLEFWATWCDPCVEAIPHLNGIVEKLNGKPIVFISITDESKEKVEAFLKEHPMKGWVAVEAKNAFSSWGVHGRPATFVIDPTGALAGKSYPDFLSAQDLDGVLAGKPLATRVEPADNAQASGSPAAGAALYEARVSISSAAKMSFESSEESFHGRGMSATLVLAQAFGVNECRVKMEPALAGLYDADVQVIGGQESKLPAAFQNAATVGFGIALSRLRREVDADVLAKGKGGALKAASAKNGKHGFSSGPGRITATGMSMAVLADALEQLGDRPVLDETGLKGRYDFELTWDPAKPETLDAALKSQLGIEKVRAKRPVELLVFKGDKGQ